MKRNKWLPNIFALSPDKALVIHGHCSACIKDYTAPYRYGILVLCPGCFEKSEKIPRGGVPITGWPDWVLIRDGRIKEASV